MKDERKTIGEFRNAHEGRWAYLFGKGPSLDLFDEDSCGEVRICVNQSFMTVDRPTYVFAHDGFNWLGSGEFRGTTFVVENRFADQLDYIPPSSKAVYDKIQCDLQNSPNRKLTPTAIDILSSSRDEIANRCVLYGTSGTAHSAVHFAWLCGIVELRLVGFDPLLGGAAADTYQTIYHDMLIEAAALGVRIVNVGEQLLKQKAGK